MTTAALAALGPAILPLAGAGAGPIVTEPGKRFPSGETPATFQGPVPRAACGPGSEPETGLQGRVPVEERESGRSADGYWCNMELVGHYGPDDPLGFEGADWQLARYGDCAYYSQRLFGHGTKGAPRQQQRRGTIALDVSDPTDPRFATNLFTSGMMNSWETLKVNRKRGLLAAVNAMDGQGVSFMGIYDIKDDCRHPKKLYDGPVTVLNHEGNFASDGNTYYSGGLQPGIISAVDTAEPSRPKLIKSFFARSVSHGMTTNQDGTRLFVGHVNDDWRTTLPLSGRGDVQSVTGGNGIGIYDVSEIQYRKPDPEVRLISALEWTDGQMGQHSLHVVRNGSPYVIHVDEAGHGGARIIDISDERQPKVVSKIKTEIMMPENDEAAEADTNRFPQGDRGDFGFGYNFHYCNVDSLFDPAILACSAFNQGLRVFDIRNLSRPREIAYFNPGGDGTRQPGSWGGTHSGYPAAMPQFVPERQEIWFTDQDRGFYVTRLTNGTWNSTATEATVSSGN